MKKYRWALPIVLCFCASAKAQNYNAGPLHINGAVYDASAVNGSTLSPGSNLVIGNDGTWLFNDALLTTPRTGTMQSEVIKFSGSSTYARNTGYVNGYVLAESSAPSFELPIGQNSYMPLMVNTSIAPGNSITAAWYDNNPLASTNISGVQYYFLPGYYDILSGNAGLDVTPSVPLTAATFSRMLGTTDGINFVDLGPAGFRTVLPSGNYQLRFANSSTSLPLTLAAFTATRQGATGLLQWKLANEYDMKEYVVERSMDNRHFTEVGVVPSLGPTSQERTYSFYDASPLKGANYYRLTMTEANGKKSYSGVRLLQFDGLVRITVFPNPVRNYVAISGLQTGMQVTVTSLQGQVLIQKKAVANTMEINLAQLPGAMYQVQVQEASGNLVGSYQVVKE